MAAFFICALLCTVGRCAEPQGAGADKEILQPLVQSGPYCGIYSLVAATAALGQPAPLGDLISRRYIGSEWGSSGAEIVEAARNNGYSASFITGLSDWELRAARGPLILRISTTQRRDVYNHWVAYLGEQSGKARILDYPDPVTLCGFGDLLSRWDGSAVAVSRDDSNARSLVTHSRVRGAFGFIFVAVLVLVLGRLIRNPLITAGARSSPTPPLRRREITAIFVVSVALALASDALRPGGLLRNAHVARALAVAHGSTTLPALTAAELRGALGTEASSKPVVIDARLPSDYNQGHIPGAVNIPAWGTAASRRSATSLIPRTANVVIYCQSLACAYDDEVAAQLIGEGFERVSLFPGGWKEWTEASSPPSGEH